MTITYMSAHNVAKVARCTYGTVINAVTYGDLTPAAAIPTPKRIHYGFDLDEVKRWMKNRRTPGVPKGTFGAPPEMLTPRRMAELAGCSYSHIMDEIKKGNLRASTEPRPEGMTGAKRIRVISPSSAKSWLANRGVEVQL